MANDTTGNPLYLDTEGIVSVRPLVIKKIIWKPNATGEATTFTYWATSEDPITNGTKNAVTTTVTASTGTFASTGNFPTANVNPNQVLVVSKTSSGDNIGIWQIATNADNDTITVDKPATIFGQSVTLADDTTESYSWKIFDVHTFLTVQGSGITGDTGLVQIDFLNGGITLPNLAMHTLSASGVAYIFLL